MNTIAHNISLKPFNTFGIDALTNWYFSFETVEQLQEYAQASFNPSEPFLILGGGSNLLFTKNYNGTVIHPAVKGIKVINENEQSVWVEVGAGEVWDDFVEWCVNNNYYGAENLSLIPGNVGATPVQNIGAYGREAKDIIHEVNVYNLEEKKNSVLSNNACQFGYRQSIFKTLKMKSVVVTSVIYQLSKKAHFHLDYGHIKSAVEANGTPSLKNIRNTIISIRASKLPDTETLGNAGSFFKNPVVPIEIANSIKTAYPQMPSYPADDKHIKIPAGWLIEQSGWKGKVIGAAGVHKDQALVIVNLGDASGKEIITLSEKIVASIKENFNITLEKEVIVI